MRVKTSRSPFCYRDDYSPIANELAARAKKRPFAYCEVGPSLEGLRVGIQVLTAYPHVVQSQWLYVEDWTSMYSLEFIWAKQDVEKLGARVLTTGFWSEEVFQRKGTFDFLAAAYCLIAAPNEDIKDDKDIMWSSLSGYFELLREGGELMCISGAPFLEEDGPVALSNGNVMAQCEFRIEGSTCYLLVGRKSSGSPKEITVWQQLKWLLFGIF